MRRPARTGIAIVALLMLAAVPLGRAAAGDLLVFAAASLRNALGAAAEQWKKQGGAEAKISFAASSALAKQIEAGAPADVFVSADIGWMDWLAKRGLIRPDTRFDFLGNGLVLVAPRSSTATLTLAKGVDVAGALGGGRLAMADPAAVPAGLYGKAALQWLGAWTAVEPRIARAENVRAALALVSRGEAPLGVVYATDAAADPGVRVVATFPSESHPAITYPAAATRAGKGDAAAAFLAFLKTPAARPFFEKWGFTVLAKGD